jgi:hypothetical protein
MEGVLVTTASGILCFDDVGQGKHLGPVYDSVRRSSFLEAFQNMALGQSKAFPLYVNAFMDVRQTVRTFVLGGCKNIQHLFVL